MGSFCTDSGQFVNTEVSMAFIDTSYLVNYIKARLGSSVKKLEIDNTAISNILYEETLRTLSVYFPKFENYAIDPNRDEVDPNQRGLFFVTPKSTLMGVERIISLGMSGSYDNGAFENMFPCPIDFMLTHAAKEIMDIMRIPYTISFLPPDKVQINPNPPYTNIIYIRIKIAHNDFSEFNPGLLEIIKKLALCDVKLDILGMRKHFTTLNTTFADIELDLGTFEEADSQRSDILEKIRANSHLSANRRKVYVP